MGIRETGWDAFWQPEIRAFAAFVGFLLLPPASWLYLPLLWRLFTLTGLLLYLTLVYVVIRRLAGGARYEGPRPNLKGKVTIVTGAAAPGIGYETSIEFAKLGAQVFVGVRGAERARETAAQIASAADVPLSKVVGLHLDLSKLKDVKQFASAVLQQTDRIDILANNAGVMFCPYSLTADGLEMQMGTNHFGHFYLTQLLLPTLLKSQARVVIVSSSAHSFFTGPQGIDYPRMAAKETYNDKEAYGHSKLANVYHAAELQRRYGDKGLKVYSLHPGGVSTALQRHIGMDAIRQPFQHVLFRTPSQGAQTTLFCAFSDQAVQGGFHADCKHVVTPLSVQHQKAQDWYDFSEEVIREKTKGFSRE